MDLLNLTSELSPEELHKLLTDLQQSQAVRLACETQEAPTNMDFACLPSFDSVLCWPHTPPQTMAVLPCMDELNGIKYDTSQNASRFCFANGTWDQYTNYSNCRELNYDISPSVEITTTIYFIGYTLSLIALIVAVFIFWKFKDLRCLRNTIHMNLMCTYILADFSWILIYTLQAYIEIKKAPYMYTYLFILLHYFHLTNFFWMFVEGLYLYILVVKTFTGESIKLRIYAAIGWGLPVIFVLLWGIAKSFTSSPDDQQTGDLDMGGNWRPHPFDWIYQGPAVVVLVVNVIFLIIIMWVSKFLSLSWVLITKLRSATSAETQQYRKAAKALLVLIPLLGITYILVIVGPAEGISRSIYDGVRAVLLSTQGFSVALFYCFLNTEVKHTVRHHFNSWHTRRTLGSRRQRFGSSKDWSPRSRDSIRLSQGGGLFKKRESTASEGTTTTLVVCHVSQNNASAAGKTYPPFRSPLLPPGDTG